MTADPFEIHVPEETLADLRGRLARTRCPETFAGLGWSAGASVDYLKELVRWWREGFDWRAQEAALNAFPHFQVDLDGTRLHFIHVRGRGLQPVPLVLTHGWPSTFYEYLKLVPLLADPESNGGDRAESFDVVVPSLPGYAFSDPLPPGEFRRVPEPREAGEGSARAHARRDATRPARGPLRARARLRDRGAHARHGRDAPRLRSHLRRPARGGAGRRRHRPSRAKRLSEYWLQTVLAGDERRGEAGSASRSGSGPASTASRIASRSLGGSHSIPPRSSLLRIGLSALD